MKSEEYQHYARKRVAEERRLRAALERGCRPPMTKGAMLSGALMGSVSWIVLARKRGPVGGINHQFAQGVIIRAALALGIAAFDANGRLIEIGGSND